MGEGAAGEVGYNLAEGWEGWMFVFLFGNSIQQIAHSLARRSHRRRGWFVGCPWMEYDVSVWQSRFSPRRAKERVFAWAGR